MGTPDTANLSEECVHFNQGRLPVAFVFSAPGAKEVKRKLPIAGDTGDNLSDALVHLMHARPDVFSSLERYDYRITNSYAKPLARSLKDNRTEASLGEILESENTIRLLKELKGVGLVVLCGRKAEGIRHLLSDDEFKVVVCSHTGNRGLNWTYRLESQRPPLTPEGRKMMRIEAWAKDLLKQISDYETSSK